jgi:hypothetical protein
MDAARKGRLVLGFGYEQLQAQGALAIPSGESVS